VASTQYSVLTPVSSTVSTLRAVSSAARSVAKKLSVAVLRIRRSSSWMRSPELRCHPGFSGANGVPGGPVCWIATTGTSRSRATIARRAIRSTSSSPRQTTGMSASCMSTISSALPIPGGYPAGRPSGAALDDHCRTPVQRRPQAEPAPAHRRVESVPRAPAEGGSAVTRVRRCVAVRGRQPRPRHAHVPA
jgi:hypothetical protein